jgi:hypothetical protein
MDSSSPRSLRNLRSWVPAPVVAYALLGLLDFGFTLLAFGIGYKEANPVLAFYKEHGLFEVAKLFTTVAVVTLGFFLWQLSIVRFILVLANAVMLAVLIYHVSFWTSLVL